MIKYLPFFILVFLGNPTNCCSQNELKARIEYDEAEKAFAEDNFAVSLEHAHQAAQNLGKWTSKVSYLTIMALDHLCDYSNLEDHYTKQLQKEVGLYMAYANKNQDVIDIDRFKTVYTIEGKINHLVEAATFLKMPDFLKGEEAYKNEDYKTAMDYFLPFAQKGSSMAMFRVGTMYDDGLGVSNDSEEAVKWYKRAALKGQSEAMLQLGYALKYGSGIEENREEAVAMFIKAAEYGNSSAMQTAGFSYEYGEGVAQSYTEAMGWYKKAASKGDKYATRNIGIMFRDGDGVVQSYKEAMVWLLKAADMGHEIAMYDVAQLYKAGNGTNRDYEKAMEWYKKAAEKGHVNAMIEIAEYYVDKKDHLQTLEWYQKAAEKGHVASMEIVARYYYYGVGVKKDKKIAKEWYDRYDAAKVKG